MQNKESKNVSLLSCPFCGGNKVGLWHNKSISPLILGTHNVQCYDCHFGLAPSKTKEEAIEKWNTRKPMQKIVKSLEKKINYNLYDPNWNAAIIAAISTV